MTRPRRLPRSLPSLGAALLPAVARVFSAWMCVPEPPASDRRRGIALDVPSPKEKQQ